MSLSVSGSNTNNPYAYLQALLQQEQSQSSATMQSADPLSELFAAIQQGAGGTSSAGVGSSVSGNATTGSSFPQFGAQTLQALLALQSSGSGSSSQSPWSQLNGDASSGTSDPTASQQTQQSEPGEHGHHHHHHMSGAGGAGGNGGQSPFELLASDSGATTQTTTNGNGSTTTSITYADGSTVTMTTAAASSDSAGSSGSSSATAGGANIAGNNLVEQLIQMQAQLLTPAATQSIATV